ncbi:hypothetical protein, partial [Bacteroides sp.]|uniref:hypothetical protein n=1 Tax=Bacteroides sp. TaxID=29523 RepID=UPI0023C92FC6
MIPQSECPIANRHKSGTNRTPHPSSNVNYFSFFFSQPACSAEKTSFSLPTAVLPICILSHPYQGLFGFGRSSDKLHS